MNFSKNGLENKSEAVRNDMEIGSNEVMPSEVLTAEQIAERDKLRDEKYLVKEPKKEEGVDRRGFLKIFGAAAIGAALGLSPDESEAKSKQSKPFKNGSEFSQEEIEQISVEVKQTIEKIKSDPNFDFTKIKELEDVRIKLAEKNIQCVAQDKNTTSQQERARGYVSQEPGAIGGDQARMKRKLAKEWLVTDENTKNLTFYFNYTSGGTNRMFNEEETRYGVYIQDLRTFVSNIGVDLSFLERATSSVTNIHDKNVREIREVLEAFKRGEELWERRIRSEVWEKHGFNPRPEHEYAEFVEQNNKKLKGK